MLESITKMKNRGMAGQVVGVFILVLVISVIVGMTFLFTSQLKTQVQNQLGSTYTNQSAWLAINSTEASGYSLVGYLPMLFLALIFGVILVVVLKVVLPYMNIGGGL